jgi:DinB family protein
MMNHYMSEKWSWIEGSQQMRTQFLDILSDDDLAFNPGGRNMTLGALFRELGEIEFSYAQSLKTFQQDWSYRNEDVGLEKSVARLKEWFQKLDDELTAAASGLSDEDLKKTVYRGGGFAMPVDMQLDVYLQALLIFFGKATIYLKAMNKELPKQVREYIG